MNANLRRSFVSLWKEGFDLRLVIRRLAAKVSKRTAHHLEIPVSSGLVKISVDNCYMIMDSDDDEYHSSLPRQGWLLLVHVRIE